MLQHICSSHLVAIYTSPKIVMNSIHKSSQSTSSIPFVSCKWGFCAKMFAIQRYWGRFHSCVSSRTGVNAESRGVKMRFAGLILRNVCSIDSCFAFVDFRVAKPRRQRNCNRGCKSSYMKLKAKKIELGMAKQRSHGAGNQIPNADNTSKQIHFMCFIKCHN